MGLNITWADKDKTASIGTGPRTWRDIDANEVKNVVNNFRASLVDGLVPLSELPDAAKTILSATDFNAAGIANGFIVFWDQGTGKFRTKAEANVGTNLDIGGNTSVFVFDREVDGDEVTLLIGLEDQLAGRVLIAPATETGTPTFRRLVVSDIPGLEGFITAQAVASVQTIADLNTFVRGDIRTVIVRDELRGGTFTYVEQIDFVGVPDNGVSFTAQDGGYWVRIFQGDIKATWYGIIPNLETSQTALFNSMIISVGEMGGGKIFVSKGEYLIEGVGNKGIDIQSDNIELFFEEGSVLVSNDADSSISNSNRGVIDVGGNFADKVSLIGDITAGSTENSKVITLSSVTGLEVGDLIGINSDDYLSGAEGVGGFGRTNKSEINKVVNISGSDVTLEISLRDTYTTAAKLYKISTVKNFTISGSLKIVGPGAKESITANGQGLNGFRANYFENIKIDYIETKDFQNAGVRLSVGRNLFVKTVNCSAPDGLTSQFYGFIQGGIDNCQCVNITGINVRHAFDTIYFFPDSFHMVSRGFSVVNAYGVNNYVASFATHPVVDSVFTNLISEKSNSGLTFRGINLILNNFIFNGANKNGGRGFLVGANDQNENTLNTNCGDIIIDNFQCKGADIPIRIMAGCNIFSLTNSNLKPYRNNPAIEIVVPKVFILKIDDNVIDLTKHTAFAQGISIAGFPTVGTTFTEISITKNKFIEVFWDAVRIVDNANNDSFGSYEIKGNKVIQLTRKKIGRLVRFNNNSSRRQDVAGNRIIGGDAWDNPTSGTGIVDPIAFGVSTGIKDLVSISNNFSDNWKFGDIYKSTATGLTVIKGQVRDSNIGDLGTFSKEMVITSGTFGTLNSGSTTATTTNGSNTVLVNTKTGLIVGQFIRIVGAGDSGADLLARIVTISSSANEITISTNALTSVTDQAVSFVNPVSVITETIGLRKGAINTSGTTLSKSTLNTTYPNTLTGFVVVAPNVPEKYTKLSDANDSDWSVETITLAT
jgi:hypothetical protein